MYIITWDKTAAIISFLIHRDNILLYIHNFICLSFIIFCCTHSDPNLFYWQFCIFWSLFSYFIGKHVHVQEALGILLTGLSGMFCEENACGYVCRCMKVKMKKIFECQSFKGLYAEIIEYFSLDQLEIYKGAFIWLWPH